MWLAHITFPLALAMLFNFDPVPTLLGAYACNFDWWISLAVTNPAEKGKLHDTLLHTIFLLPVLVLFLHLFWSEAILPFTVGFLTHPILDGLGPGSPWLYPVSTKHFGLGLWKNYFWETDSAKEDIKRYFKNATTLALEFFFLIFLFLAFRRVAI